MPSSAREVRNLNNELKKSIDLLEEGNEAEKILNNWLIDRTKILQEHLETKQEITDGDKDLAKTYDIDKQPLKHNFRGNSPLARENKQEKYKNVIKSLQSKIKTKSVLKETLKEEKKQYNDKGSLLDEGNIIAGSI